VPSYAGTRMLQAAPITRTVPFVLAALGLTLTTLIACASAPEGGSKLPGPVPDPLQFSFYAADGTRFDSAGTRGRVTVILILTTYDLNSQLVARRLNELQRTYKPRFNAGAVVLESMKYAVLVEPFKASLGLTYPVVLADHDMLQGQGAFGAVTVPTLILLDPEGRPVWRVTGPATEQQLRKALNAAMPAEQAE